MSKWLLPIALAAGLASFGATASAAPVGNLNALEAPKATNVDRVAYRRCWRHRGHLHCRRVFRRYGYYSDPYYYDSYPYYGYSYGPAFGFTFGGGRHFHGGMHHHGRR